jgi:TRAP-type transport system periplasmic protein
MQNLILSATILVDKTKTTDIILRKFFKFLRGTGGERLPQKFNPREKILFKERLMSRKLVILSVGLLISIFMLISACSQPPSTSTPTQTQAPAPTTQVTTQAPIQTTAAAATTAQPTKAAKPIQIVLSNFQPITNTETQVLQEWIPKIEAATNNRVKIIMYSGNTLVAALEQWDSAVAGVCQMTHCSKYKTTGSQEWKDASPYMKYGIPSIDIAEKMMHEVMLPKYPQQLDEYKDLNVIYEVGTTPQRLMLQFPIPNFEALKGKIIRTPGTGEELKEMGASPVSMPMADVYMALQKGTVQGMTGPYEVLKAFSLADVTKYYLDNCYKGITGGYEHMTAMNWDTWNSLPKDIQAAFIAQKPWVESEMNKRLEAMDIAAVELAKSKGGQFVKWDQDSVNKFYAAMHRVSMIYVKKLEDKGQPGLKAYADIENWKEKNVTGYQSQLFVEKPELKQK